MFRYRFYPSFPVLVSATLFLVSGPVFSQPPGEMLERCESCHGKDGNSTEVKVPTIAGLSVEYLSDALGDFREGKRKGKPFKALGHEETDMNKVSHDLSDGDIRVLARYFSEKPFLPRKQKYDPVLAKKGKRIYVRRCERCHEDSGRSAEDDMGRLAGQSMPYLERQMAEFLNGERKPPKKMAKQLRKLKPGDVPPLLHFFAAQQN